LAQGALAQTAIVPTTDATSSTGTIVNYTDAQYDIQGGTVSGGNLFHRYERFGLAERETANFMTSADIQNVFNLIRGTEVSEIHGTLQLSTGSANLFLINPAGVIFGATAQLAIPASLHVSTADGLLFDNHQLVTVDGLALEGMDPESWSIEVSEVSDLTAVTGVPTDYVFAAANPAGIMNYGDLVVKSGESITFLGGTVHQHGRLTAPGGTVTLASVTGGQVVRVGQTGSLLSFEIAPQTAADPTPFDSGGEIVLTPEMLTGSSENEATTLAVLDDGTAVLEGSPQTSTGAGLNEDEIGTTLVRGEIDVSGDESGNINISGRRVALVDATLSANGTTVGGITRIGGSQAGFEADDPNFDALSEVYEALTSVYVLVDRESQFSAVATDGSGGKVLVWADEQVQFYGQVDVRGGPNGTAGILEVDSDGLVQQLSSPPTLLPRLSR
jgi:filamentous hemagglutinin family protein